MIAAVANHNADIHLLSITLYSEDLVSALGSALFRPNHIRVHPSTIYRERLVQIAAITISEAPSPNINVGTSPKTKKPTRVVRTRLR